MVSCLLQGGLGNNLFQVSAAYCLALDNNDRCIFSTEILDRHSPLSTYMNNIFRKLTFDDAIVNSSQWEPNGYFKKKLFKILKKLKVLESGGQKIHRQLFFNYYALPYYDGIILKGFFQSEKFFINHKDEIWALFSIDEKSLNYINGKYGKLLANNTCSIHVRRGDYLIQTDNHPVCEKEYYLSAMNEFNSETTFLIFSDDIEWCKNNFIGEKIFYIENEKDYIDLWLMSLCDDNIIANSSFSWWGAWLNRNENKKVIAPGKWFGPSLSHLNTHDLIPETWSILISSL